MKNENGSIKEVLKRIFIERFNIFLCIVGLLTGVFFVLNFLDFFDDLKRVVDFFKSISERLVDFVIFLPSLTFACLGLLPSVGRNMKIKLSRNGTDGHRLIDSLLNQLSFVMYVSLMTLVIAITVNVFLDAEASLLVDFSNSCFWKLCLFIFFLIFLLPACLVVDQLFMTVYIVHSLVLGEFRDAEMEFEEVKKLLQENKLKPEDFQSAIDKKIEDNLTSTSIDRLHQLKTKRDEPEDGSG